MVDVNKMKVAVHLTLGFLLSYFLILSLNCSPGLGDDENNQRQKVADQTKLPIIDAAKSLFSLPTSNNFWVLKIKGLLPRGWPYLLPPPNLDFRRGSGGGDNGMNGKEGATEKVKEAVVKSVDKSKATVEGSAELAEEVVFETVKGLKDEVYKNVKRLKETLFGKGRKKVAEDRETEL